LILSRGSKIAISLGVITLALFVFKLYFRAFIYADMYIAPGDAYGISDIIEFLLGCVLLLLHLISLSLAIFLLFRGVPQSRKAALVLITFSVIIFVLHSPLRSVAARWEM